MLPDRVSNPGPLTYESGVLPIALHGPALKIEKPFKPHLLLGQWADFKIISQECSLDDPLPKLLKWFCSAEQNGHKS